MPVVVAATALALSIVVAGCGGTNPILSSAALSQPTPTPTAAPTPTAMPSPVRAPTPTPYPTPTVTPVPFPPPVLVTDTGIPVVVLG
ncbi:MAG TPA: hypothetical protein VLD62_04060, partial [Acidimicrobiia bacterium]|nr:hypothetical protein [Acidimicrobiia bacterium]